MKDRLPSMEAPMPATPVASQRIGALRRGPSLADVLATRLKNEIAEGRLQSGEKLPSEHELSESYGVSRPTVREAIGRLKHDGLVVTKQGSGVFVADPRGSTVFRLDIADFGDFEDIEKIIELLMAIEGSATQIAAERRTPDDLREIRARLEAMQAAIDRGEPGVDEDVAFHRAIIDATGNAYFRDLSDFLDRRVRSFIRMARTNSARHAGLTQAVQVEHQAIFDAIERRDAQAARAAAEAHLINASKRLILYNAR